MAATTAGEPWRPDTNPSKPPAVSTCHRPVRAGSAGDGGLEDARRELEERGASLARWREAIDQQLTQLRALAEDRDREIDGLRSRLNERIAAIDAKLEELASRENESMALSGGDVAKLRETLRVLKEHHPYRDFPEE